MIWQFRLAECCKGDNGIAILTVLRPALSGFEPRYADPESWGTASAVGASAKPRLNVQKVRDRDRLLH